MTSLKKKKDDNRSATYLLNYTRGFYSRLGCIPNRVIKQTMQYLRLPTITDVIYFGHWVVKSRRMRWAGHVARMGEGRGVHRVLVGKPEGKRPLERPRRRWEGNIKMDLQ
jgi:hypothetical protein